MTTYYVDSHGSNTSPYDTWAKAANLLVTATALTAAGDTVYVAHNHSETSASTINATAASSTTNPCKVICANSGAQPPTTLATTAVVATTGNSSINIGGTGSYWYGIQFSVGSGAASPSFSATFSNMRLVNCAIALGGTTGGNIVPFGNNGSARNCTFKFASASSYVSSTSANTRLLGCSLAAGGTSPTVMFSGASNNFLVDGFDLSNASAGVNLVDFTGSGSVLWVLRNIKLPASFSGALYANYSNYGVLSIFNADSAGTNYRMVRRDYAGEWKDETTYVRAGGANDGTTALAWKCVSTADAKFIQPTDSPEIVVWNDLTGASRTATVEILHDSATNLKDDEVWLEVEYLGTSGAPLGSFVDDAKAGILATAADQTTSSATWTTTSMTNPNKQTLSVAFTPQLKGFVHARVKVAKASYTVYVDPLLTIS